MALDRQLPTSASSPPVLGTTYVDAVQEEITGLWDRSVCRLTSVAGTNTITASVVPAMTAGYVNQMRFVLIPANTTTSSTVTLNIDSAGAKTVLTNTGAAPAAGAIVAGAKYLLEYDSTANAFYVLSYLPPTGFDDRPSFRNVCSANGGCEVWQRGTPVAVPASSATGVYTLDRFYLITSAGQASTVTRTSFNSDRSRYAAVIQRNTGEAGTTQMQFSYPLTTEEVSRLIGSKCTLSMKLSIGANWSPASGTLNYAFVVGTGAEGKSAGFTGATTVLSGSVNLVGVTTVSATSAAVVPTTATQGEIKFTWTPVGAAGAQDWWVLDNMQLESGTVVTEFEFAPFDIMLKQCERHFCKTFPYDTAPATSGGLAGALSSDKDLTDFGSAVNAAFLAIPAAGVGFTMTRLAPTLSWRFPSRMRATPTIVTYNPSAANANIRLPTGTSGAPIDSVVTVSPHTSTGDSGVTFIGTGVSSGITAAKDQIGYLHAAASADL